MRRAPLLRPARSADTADSRAVRSRMAGRRLAAVATTALTVVALGAGTADAATARPAKPSIGRPASVASAHTSAAASMAAKRARFGRRVLAEAAHFAGRPYVYGASGPGAFDCSGFTRYVYGSLGVSLAHSSYAQYDEVQHIPASQALPGDIVFLNGLGHVGIYAGHGRMWDAPSPGGRVSLRPIYSSAYAVGRVRL